MVTDVILDGLNASQREAVQTVEGPLLVVAGPGSGKTRVITHRIAYLIKVCGVSPYRIAAVTFTNKAAREMRVRLDDLLGSSVRDLTVETFHGFCANVLRREGDYIGLDRNYVIYDDADQIATIKSSMKATNLNPEKYLPKTFQAAISNAKSQLIDPEGFGLNIAEYQDELKHRVYEQYEKEMSRSSAVDFDDLLLKTHFLFSKFSDIADKYQHRYVHFMIDEFQDTNLAQYAIARQLDKRHGNLAVVGDPDQSIYSWRKADIRNILNFQKDYPAAKVIALTENYRSTKTILQAAEKLITPNKKRLEKDLWTSNGLGVAIAVSKGRDTEDEARLVVGELNRLVQKEGYSRGDVAVMYRVNNRSKDLETACQLSNIPYQKVGQKLYQTQEIKDLLAYLRLILNPNDDVSFARVINVPLRGIGRRTINELNVQARYHGISMFAAIQTMSKIQDGVGQPPVSLPPRLVRALSGFEERINGLMREVESLDTAKMIDLVMERVGYKSYIEKGDRAEVRLENLERLKSAAKDYDNLGGLDGLTAFLETMSLESDVDRMDEEMDAITLITLHQAKGLEFPVVFIVGMEEGTLPHSRSKDNKDEMEEERRLFYVGVTRAKERLYLLHSEKTMSYWEGNRYESRAEISRFLEDIPENLKVSLKSPVGGKVNSEVSSPKAGRALPGIKRRRVARESGTGPGSVSTSKMAGASKLSISTGDKVCHKVFGEGIVLETKRLGVDVDVKIAFKIEGKMQTKRLLLSVAPMEKMP